MSYISILRILDRTELRLGPELTDAAFKPAPEAAVSFAGGELTRKQGPAKHMANRMALATRLFARFNPSFSSPLLLAENFLYPLPPKTPTSATSPESDRCKSIHD